MKRKFSIVIGLILIFAGTTAAQNFNDVLRLAQPGVISSARALGMGNTYYAAGDDYTAAIFNPAGLGLLKRMEFNGSMNYNSFSSNTAFINSSQEYSQSSTDLNQIGFAFPLPTARGSLVFSLGYNQTKVFNKAVKFDAFNSTNTSMAQFLTSLNDDIAYELGLSYETDAGDQTIIDGNLNQSGTILQDGGINEWTFGGAIEVAQNTFFGASLNVLSGTFTNNREYLEEDTRNLYQGLADQNDIDTEDFLSFYLNDIIEQDLAGWNAKIGFLYKGEFTRFGFAIKFPTKYTVTDYYFVDGEGDFQYATFFLDPPIESEIEYDISTPYEFSGGVAVDLGELTASADLTLIDYTQMEFSNGLDTRDRSEQNRLIKDIFTNVLNYNLGLEYDVPRSGIVLRGGFIYRPSAFKDDTSEYDRKYLTAGIGFQANKLFRFDVGYAYGWWEDFGDNYGTDVSRTFQENTVNNLLFSVVYNF